MITVKLVFDPSFRDTHDIVYYDAKSEAAFKDTLSYMTALPNCYVPSKIRNHRRANQVKRNYIGRPVLVQKIKSMEVIEYLQ